MDCIVLLNFLNKPLFGVLPTSYLECNDRMHDAQRQAQYPAVYTLDVHWREPSVQPVYWLALSTESVDPVYPTSVL